MGVRVHTGRFSVSNSKEIVVFILGVRVNRFRMVRKWLPVIRAVNPMLRALAADRDSGLLGYSTYRRLPRELVVVQYWRGTEELIGFAHQEMHRKAWNDFYRLATAGAAVGIWHETYVVPAGRYETIYGIVPKIAMASFGELVPIGRRNKTAAVRLGEG